MGRQCMQALRLGALIPCSCPGDQGWRPVCGRGRPAAARAGSVLWGPVHAAQPATAGRRCGQAHAGCAAPVTCQSSGARCAAGGETGGMPLVRGRQGLKLSRRRPARQGLLACVLRAGCRPRAGLGADLLCGLQAGSATRCRSTTLRPTTCCSLTPASTPSRAGCARAGRAARACRLGRWLTQGVCRWWCPPCSRRWSSAQRPKRWELGGWQALQVRQR